VPAQGGPAVQAQQNTVGNAAVIQMLQDKKLAAAVSTLQQAAEAEIARRAETLAQGPSYGKSSYPLEITLAGVQSEGYAYWRGEDRREPVWDLTLEGIPELSHLGANAGYVVDTQQIAAKMQASITFQGEQFDDWGVASYRYGGGFEVWPGGMGASATGGAWGLVGTM
jgi:hypothetical protein